MKFIVIDTFRLVKITEVLLIKRVFTPQRLIEEKNSTVGIAFEEVDNLYRSTLENVFAISIPVLSLAIPSAYSLFQYSKKRSRMRRLGYVSTFALICKELKSSTINIKFIIPMC